MRRVYRAQAELHGVAWTRRTYDADDFASGDPVNQALSAATASLYGVTHAVIVALGCSPGLGFVHTGHVRSFVFDIADLYKAEYAIPCAFETASHGYSDIGAETRRAMRDAFKDGRLLERCVRDIHHLLTADESDESVEEPDVVRLWDGGTRTVAAGASWGDVDW